MARIIDSGSLARISGIKKRVLQNLWNEKYNSWCTWRYGRKYMKVEVAKRFVRENLDRTQKSLEVICVQLDEFTSRS